MESERRKPGRPRAQESKTSVSTWIPERQADQLIKIANRHDMSVSELVSRLIRRAVDAPPK